MIYSEAKELQKQREKAWDDYYEKCGKPTLKAFEDCVLNAPDDVFNYNIISRYNGVMIAASNDKGVYEYPSGLMAWGGGIPEEAYVSDDDLNKDVWQVLSRKETYDW